MNIKEAIIRANKQANIIPSLFWYVVPFNKEYCIVDHRYIAKFPETKFIYNTYNKRFKLNSNQYFEIKVKDNVIRKV
jgi:hypothetical protein